MKPADLVAVICGALLATPLVLLIVGLRPRYWSGK